MIEGSHPAYAAVLVTYALHPADFLLDRTAVAPPRSKVRFDLVRFAQKRLLDESLALKIGSWCKNCLSWNCLNKKPLELFKLEDLSTGR